MKSNLWLLLALLVLKPLTSAEAAPPPLPAEIFRALRSPAAVTLYAVDPDPQAFRWWFSRRFHGYRIRGQVAVARPAEQRQVAAVVTHAAQTYGGDNKCAFSPRHAVRLSSGRKTYDFLICFECSRVEVYSDDQLIAERGSGGSPDVLNRILHAAHIGVAP